MATNDTVTHIEHSLAAVGGSLKQALVKRALDTVIRSVEACSDREVERLQSSNDGGLLSSLAGEALRNSPLPADRVARMRLKGAQRFNDMIDEQGGVYTAKQVAQLLQKTETAVLRGCQSDRRKYLAFTRNGVLAFPVSQFENGAVIQGIREVGAGLPDNLPVIEVIRFMLTPVDAMEQRTPLELLRDGIDIEVVTTIAEQFLNHTAQ